MTRIGRHPACWIGRSCVKVVILWRDLLFVAYPSRRAILAALASGATATDLAGRLPITRQAIAKHRALLAEAGLVTAEPAAPGALPVALRRRCWWRSSSWPRRRATGTPRSAH